MSIILDFLSPNYPLADVKIYPPMSAAVRAGISQKGRYRIEMYRSSSSDGLETVTHHVSKADADTLASLLPDKGFVPLEYRIKNVRHFRRGVLE